MDIDEPTTSGFIPSLAQLASAHPPKPKQIHVHFHNHVTINSTNSSSNVRTDQLNLDTRELADLNINDTKKQSLDSAETSSAFTPQVSYGSCEQSIDHKMERMFASESLQKLKNEEAPVLSFPFFDPTKVI